MTSLLQQIEDMRIRMNELATNEQDLVRALGDAFLSADQKLLQDIRSVATEHEARRSAILNELQSLSARMGALPMSREPFNALTEDPVDLLLGDAPQLARRRGDWRQAAANVEDAVDHHSKIRASVPDLAGRYYEFTTGLPS